VQLLVLVGRGCAVQGALVRVAHPHAHTTHTHTTQLNTHLQKPDRNQVAVRVVVEAPRDRIGRALVREPHCERLGGEAGLVGLAVCESMREFARCRDGLGLRWGVGGYSPLLLFDAFSVPSPPST